MSDYDEHAKNASARTAGYAVGLGYMRAVTIRGVRTDEELKEWGYVCSADVDGQNYAWASEKRFQTFVDNQPLHKKKITNIKYFYDGTSKD